MTATRTAPKPLPRKTYFTNDDRAAVAAGYRHLADLIESGQAPIPTNAAVSLWVALSGNDVDEEPTVARELMRALGGGTYEKDVATSGGYLILRGTCAALPIDIWLTRDAVCERVVVGEERVEIPARPAEPARVEVREIVEWRCAPLLAAAETADAVQVSA